MDIDRVWYVLAWQVCLTAWGLRGYRVAIVAWTGASAFLDGVAILQIVDANQQAAVSFIASAAQVDIALRRKLCLHGSRTRQPSIDVLAV
jgi:hypothetical protein